MAKRKGIYKRGDTYWISYAYNGRTIRKSTGQKNFRIAQDMLQAVKADITRDVYNLDREPAPLFEEYADYFIEYYSKPNKRSWKRDISSMKHLRAVFSGLRLSDINREHINRYKVDRKCEKTNKDLPPAVATINRELALLKTMLNLAKEEGKVEHNPVAGRGVLFKENNKVDRILSPTEEGNLYEQCLENLPKHIYWFVYAALQTGMRRGELLKLKWQNVDLIGRTITVAADTTKSGKARTIPINKNLTMLLEDIKNETFKKGEYVFTGKRALKDIKNSFDKAKKLAGIDKRFRFHDLRHTVASRLVTENNIDLVTVAKILGHSSLKMLERYAHTRKEIETNAMETLSDTGIEPQLHNYCTIADSDENAKVANT